MIGKININQINTIDYNKNCKINGITDEHILSSILVADIVSSEL